MKKDEIENRLELISEKLDELGKYIISIRRADLEDVVSMLDECVSAVIDTEEKVQKILDEL
jgi:hypothetical protein